MKTAVVLACLVVATTADLGDVTGPADLGDVASPAYLDVLKEEWSSFKEQHGKNYDGNEDAERMKVYLQNRLLAARHNRQYYQGAVTYKLGSNKYDDLRHDEFLSLMRGTGPDFDDMGFSDKLVRTSFIAAANIGSQVQEVDWVMSGAVTDVKDQGKCDCSWAFSATGAIEGQQYRKTGDLVPLSEQNLVDCSKKYGNKGCKGGKVTNAFKYVEDNGGIDTAEAYPYEGVGNVPCRYNAKGSGATVTGIVEIATTREDLLMKALITVGPVSATIDGSLSTFKAYSAGVYYDENCSSTKINHSVLVVGFGTENGKDYWLVKNSWGTDWGQDGYAKMARNRKNACGIATAATYPLV